MCVAQKGVGAGGTLRYDDDLLPLTLPRPAISLVIAFGMEHISPRPNKKKIGPSDPAEGSAVLRKASPRTMGAGNGGMFGFPANIPRR